MKTKSLNRWVAFALMLVMMLPMVTVPSFAKSIGGIAYSEDAVWREDFEDATTVNDVAKSWAALASVKASLTDAENKVFDLPIKPNAAAPYYLWIDKGNKTPLSDYTVDATTGQVTGTATISGVTYNVTGDVNTNNASTKATVNSCSSATPKTVYVVTGEVADALGGISNIANPTYFRNPAWNNGDVDAFVVDMRIYLSADAKGVIATQITGTKLEDDATRYIQPFKITANGSSATLGLGDNGEMKSGSTKTLALGRWHKLTFVIDKDDSSMDVYANGVHAFKAEMKTSPNNYTKVSGPVNIVANSLFVQINRGSTPSNLKGSVEVDDIAFYPSYKASVWSEGFENVATLSEIASTSAVDATVGASLTDANDRVFSLPVRGTAPSPYYLYEGANSKAAFTDYSIDEETGMLTGTAVLGGLTYNVTGVINTDSTDTAATVNSCSGTAAKVYVTTGELADALGGFLGNVARPISFKNPTWNNADVEDFVIDMDFYMSKGASGDFATQITAATVASGALRYIQPLLIVARGNEFATVTVNTNGTIAEGATTQIKTGVWNRITVVIDKETSQALIYVNGVYAFTQEGKIRQDSYQKINEPVNISANTFSVQYNRGLKPSQLKGTIQIDDIAFYNSVQGLDLSMYGNDFEACSHLIGQRPTTSEGFTETPNTAVFAEDPTNPDNTVVKVEVRGNADDQNDHVRNGNTIAPIIDGKVTIKGVVYTPSNTTVGATNVTLTAENGSTLTGYQILTHSEADRIVGGGNVAVAVTPKFSAISYAVTPKVVMQTKYFLSEDMKGVLEVQASDGGWLNSYLIDASESTAYVKQLSGLNLLAGASATVNRGEWFTVHLVWDLVTAQQDIYVNGKFAFAQTYTTAKSNLVIGANKWYPVKIQRNKVAQGTVYADDFKIYNAENFLDGFALAPNYTEDFGAYKNKIGSALDVGTDRSSTATYQKDPTDANNTVVKIPFTPLKNETEILMRLSSGGYPVENGYYTVTRNAETNAVEVAGCTVTEEEGGTYTVVDGETTYTGVVLTTKDQYHAYWGGDKAINQNWRLAHPILSCNSHRFVEINVSYYLSSDANGEFQVQAYRYANAVKRKRANYLSLLYVNATTGTIGFDGDVGSKVLTKGAWNKVTLIMDLSSGSSTLYVNDVYLANKDLGDDIVLEEVCFAKIPRTLRGYQSLAGYIMMDDLSVGIARNQTVEIEGDKLMYVEVGGERIYSNRFYLPAGTPYFAKYFDETPYADMLSTVKAASVRLNAPSGLRFATQVNTEKLDALYALAVEGEIERVKIGTLIAPASYITTDFTKSALTDADKKFVTAEATHGRYYAVDKDPLTTHFVGSIVNLKDTSIARDFAGRGYAEVKLLTGETVTIYSDVYHTTSVKYVAQQALNDTGVTYDDQALEILQSFAAGAVSPDAPTEADLYGLNVVSIGDSLFQGARNNDGEFQWINILARKYGWNSTNLGIGGASISYQPQKNLSNVSMYDMLFNHFDEYNFGSDDTVDERYYTVGTPSGKCEDVDIVILQAGSNDYGVTCQTPLGTIGSTDPATFLGAWKLVVDKLLEVYPNATVVMMTAWHNGNQTRYDNANAIEFTSSVVDLYEELYKTNSRVALIDSGDPEISNVYMMDYTWRTTYSHDAFHLNDEGMEIMAESMTPYLMTVASNLRHSRK